MMFTLADHAVGDCNRSLTNGRTLCACAYYIKARDTESSLKVIEASENVLRVEKLGVKNSSLK